MGKKSKKLNGFYSKERVDGVDIIWVYGLNYKSNTNTLLRFLHMIQYSLLALIISILIVKRCDFIMGTTVPSFSGLVALFLAKLKKSCFVIEIRDVWPEELIDIGLIRSDGLVAQVLRSIEKLLYKKSNFIISSLPNTNNHVQKIIKDKKVLYLPNPLDSSLEFNVYSGGEESKLEIAYVGSSARAMSIDTILKSISLLDSYNINLTIVGPKDYVQNFYKSKKQPIPKNISLFDFVPKNKIPYFINKADVLIHSCIDSDQLKFGINSNKLLDYLSSGRVVILAAKVKNDPVSLSSGGYLIKPEDEKVMAKQIESIFYMSPNERYETGKKGLDYVELNLREDLLTQKLIKLFK